MIRVELGSGQVANAQALLVRLEARAFPEPGEFFDFEFWN